MIVVSVTLILSVLVILACLLYHWAEFLVLALTPIWLRKKKDIRGQNVLITGAGSGIGRQLAIEFSKLSTCLILMDIDKGSLLNTEKMLEGKCRVFIYECDVTDRKRVYELAEKIKRDAGDVDILVNNAGIVNGKDLLDLEDDKIVKCMEVNALSHFWMCKAFLPAMMEKNSGHIVSIASMLGLFGCLKLSDYCASKFAAIGFSQCLDLELREKGLDGIKVTIACPAFVNTGLFEGFKDTLFYPLTPQEVAKRIVNGVLLNEETIYIPSEGRLAKSYTSLAPRWLMFYTFKITGNINVMKNFKGRKDATNVAVER